MSIEYSPARADGGQLSKGTENVKRKKAPRDLSVAIAYSNALALSAAMQRARAGVAPSQSYLTLSCIT